MHFGAFCFCHQTKKRPRVWRRKIPWLSLMFARAACKFNHALPKMGLYSSWARGTRNKLCKSFQNKRGYPVAAPAGFTCYGLAHGDCQLQSFLHPHVCPSSGRRKMLPSIYSHICLSIGLICCDVICWFIFLLSVYLPIFLFCSTLSYSILV